MAVWAVQFDFGLSPDVNRQILWESLLQPIFCTVTPVVGRGVEVQVTVESDTLLVAIHRAAALTVPVVGAEPTGVVAMSPDAWRRYSGDEGAGEE